MSNAATTPAAEGEALLRRRTRMLFISLALIVTGSIGAYAVKTDFGRVDVTGFTLPTQDGQWVAADIFRPLAASSKNPVPLVVVCPGFERSKETLDSYAIEIARRGMAVITIDPYAQGASSSSRQRRSATLEGYGVIPMVEYVASTPNLNYVDKTRIGAAGYSAGGNAVIQAASHFGGRLRAPRRAAAARDSTIVAAKNATAGVASVTTPKRKSKKTAKAAAAPDSAVTPAPKPPSKLAAVFVGGYVLTLTGSGVAPVRSNVAMDYALHDEGAFRNALKHADMRNAPEALRLVNSGLSKDSAVSTVEIGKAYGDPAARTMRVVYNTNNIHPLLSYGSDTRELADWWKTAGNPDWMTQRQRTLELLEAQAHLERMARIVGRDALPAGQQVKLLCADLFNEGFLRQSSFSKTDRYCSPERQVAIRAHPFLDGMVHNGL